MKIPYDKMIYFPIGGKVLFISERKVKQAQRCKQKVLIGIYDGKIVKRTGNNRWQYLTQVTTMRYQWVNSDYGDSEYLGNYQYQPLPNYLTDEKLNYIYLNEILNNGTPQEFIYTLNELAQAKDMDKLPDDSQFDKLLNIIHAMDINLTLTPKY